LDFLTTGCHGLDRMLGGGLSPHRVNLVYGEAATGKSILAMQCALDAARAKSKVFYVDADQAFSANRVGQISDSSDLAESIVIFRPGDLEEQSKIVENVENMLSKTPTLLVVDSITGLYRGGRGNETFSRDRELNRQMAQLHALATRFAVWVLLLGQVHSSPSGGEWLVEPVATRTLRRWSDVILRLRKTARRDVRDCVLEKRNGNDISGVHCPFRITENGIEDVD
jgi:RecA/RadA recombinase